MQLHTRKSHLDNYILHVDLLHVYITDVNLLSELCSIYIYNTIIIFFLQVLTLSLHNLLFIAVSWCMS